MNTQEHRQEQAIRTEPAKPAREASRSAEIGLADEFEFPRVTAQVQFATLSYLQRAAGNFAVTGMIQRKADLFTDVKPVTPTAHAQVEAVLTPGATLEPAKGPGALTAPPVVKGPPPMTGAGKGGPFETDMLSALKTSVGAWATDFRKLKAKAPAFPVAGAATIAKAAQREVESYFAGYIQVASREPADVYHPGGGYSLVSKLGDESTRPLADGDRAGWTNYWMTLKGVGQDVLDTYHCVPTRSPDDTEFYRVLDVYVKANKTDIDDTIHGWPAEAGTGTVFIQPYTAADPKDLRTTRWDVFTTLIHEMMHIVAHPNFSNTADLIGGTAHKYLTEGFAEVMRHDLWDGPGNLKGRVAADAALRTEVEGATKPYDAASVVYHSDYDEYAQAKEIVSKVGMADAKAAFFLGHTEYLGLGEGTASEHSLSKVAQWTSKDSTEKDTYVVMAGDTYDTVKDKLSAPAGSLLTSTGTALAPGAALAAGTKVRVPGIQRVWVIKGDTVGSVADQHGISTDALAKANDLPSRAPATALTTGAHLYIPIH